MGWLGYLEQKKTIKQINEFKKIMPVECTVVRNGKEIRILANQLVIGDLVWIRIGDRVPADLNLIYTNNFKIELLSIIGSAKPLEYIDTFASKDSNNLDKQNIAFSGSFCTNGEALGIVIRVGNNTLIGKMVDLLCKEDHEKNYLVYEHHRFVRFITFVSLLMATVTFFIGLLLNNFNQFATTFVNGFLIVLVVNIPQGLPIILIAQLLFKAKRLNKKCGKMSLKSIHSVDTLGMTSVFMTNKLGVLTCNKFRLTDLWFTNEYFDSKNLKSKFFKNSVKTHNNEFEKLKNETIKNSTETNNQSFENNCISNLQQDFLHEILDIMSICNNAFQYSNNTNFICNGNKLKHEIKNEIRDHYLTTGCIGEWFLGQPFQSIVSLKNRSKSICFKDIPINYSLKTSNEDYKKKKFLNQYKSQVAFTVFPIKDDNVIYLNNKNLNNKKVELNKKKPNLRENLLKHLDLKEPSAFGRPIDIALLNFVEEFANIEHIRNKYEIVFEIPFTAYNRYHLAIVAKREEITEKQEKIELNIKNKLNSNFLTLVNENSTEKNDEIQDEEFLTYKLMVKGAPEELISNCSTIVTENGTIEKINDNHLYQFEKAYLKFAEEGKTCLAFAYLEFKEYANAVFYSSEFYDQRSFDSNSQSEELWHFPKNDWCFLGMIALLDPLKPNITEAIQKVRDAGIRLFMVTGDHPTTAETLARQIGFSTSNFLNFTTTSFNFNKTEEKNSNTKTKNKLLTQSLGNVKTVVTNQLKKITLKKNEKTSSIGSSGYLSGDSEKSSTSPQFYNFVETEWSQKNNKNNKTLYSTKDKSESDIAVVHGDVLENLSESVLNKLLKRQNIVFARITPSQKLQLVKQCQKLNYVVTLIGDGLMDVLALKQANIGITTNVEDSVFAKEASDIVITGNDLKNLLQGIEEARLLFDNIKKTIAYILSHMLSECLPVILSIVFGFPLGLNSLQILIIDLLIEIPPSIALIFEPPERDIMKRPPQKKNSHLVTPQLLIYSYAIAGNLISVGCLISYFSVFWSNGFSINDLKNTAKKYWHLRSPALNATIASKFYNYEKEIDIRNQANAAWHITLVVTQIFHMFMCTTRRTSIFQHGIQNKKLLGAFLFEIIFLITLVFIPKLQNLCKIKPPPNFIWIIPIVISVILLLITELNKLLIRKKPNSFIVKILKW